MRSKFLEATNGEKNWGKFLVSVFEPADWEYRSVINPGSSLMRTIGWGSNQALTLVTDLQTGEGAMFLLHGHAGADLEKHKVWVCPLFEPMLGWLYMRYKALGPAWFETLPVHVDLPDAAFELYGYRRKGQREGT